MSKLIDFRQLRANDELTIVTPADNTIVVSVEDVRVVRGGTGGRSRLDVYLISGSRSLNRDEPSTLRFITPENGESPESVKRTNIDARSSDPFIQKGDVGVLAQRGGHALITIKDASVKSPKSE